MTENLRCPECGSANVVFSKKRRVNVCQDIGYELAHEKHFAPMPIGGQHDGPDTRFCQLQS
jgi:ribosomal protein S27E